MPSDAAPRTAPRPTELIAELIAATRACAVEKVLDRRWLADWRQRAADSFKHWSRRQDQPANVAQASAALRALADAGANDFAAPAEHVERAKEFSKEGWGGMLAAMVLVPAWQWSDAPRLQAVPTWMVGITAEYVWARPSIWTDARQPEVGTRQHISAMIDLKSLLHANRASLAARSAVDSFNAFDSTPPVDLCGELGAAFRAARADLIAELKRTRVALPPVPCARGDRRLRVGVLARALETSRVTHRLLPLIERLAPTRFELVLFTVDETDTPITRQLVNRGASRSWLTGTPEDMQQVVVDAQIDVAVFVLEQNWSRDPVAGLASLRLAPLQVGFDGTGRATALRGCDAYVATPGELAQHRNDRPIVLPRLPIVGLNELEQCDAPEPWSRADIGATTNDVVVVITGELHRHSPAALTAWISLLARHPQIRLALCATETEPKTAARFCAHFAGALAAAGIATDRVTVLPDAGLGTHAARKSCLHACDIVLALHDDDGGDTSLAALEVGVPIVAVDNTNGAQTSAELLRLAGCPNFIAATNEAAVELVGRLAQDGESRRTFGQSLRTTAPQVMAAHDSFVRSELFGRVIETAFDAVVEAPASPATAFKLRVPEAPETVVALAEEIQAFLELGSGIDAESRARSWLIAQPGAPEPRKALARALSLQGRDAEAAALWLSVVDLTPSDAAAWHELARASQGCQRMADAVHALKTALSLDDKRVDSWLLLAELADRHADHELRRDVIDVLQQLAPDRPEVRELAAAAA